MITTVVFALAAGTLFYIVVVYPFLAALIAWRTSFLSLEGNTRLPIVSVILPVHNGAGFLKAKLDSILNLNYPKDRIEILVIDDGSTDTTVAIANSFSRNGVRCYGQPKSGKPAAINLGMSHAGGEIVVFTDVRQQLGPEGLRLLIARFRDPRVGVVSGRLIIRVGDHSENTVGLYWRYEFWIRRQLSRIDSIFGATGSYYAIRRELAVPIPADTLLDDMYLPLAAFFEGYRLVVEENAIAYDYPTGIESEFSRKVRTLAGNYQILGQYPQLLTSQNRMLFHFLSYKFARLSMPWLALVLAVSSFGLPQPLARLTVSAQAIFYGLAALDLVIPASIPIKPITAAPRTVVSLLAATVVALRIFFVPAQELWKPTIVGSVPDSPNSLGPNPDGQSHG